MDRVVMGDVGYGKTEIAVRAAFKAVQDGKQVAILVPTTLLVQQHYGTFRDRFQAFPVKVRAVSRFNSDREQKEVMDGVRDGSVDVVIGTHRLLSKDTKFKDLGLVIVDEEQRFGVEHKEFIKQMRTAVDVLTMSATPIPRTLEMSLTGIREMSTILTPPEERHPVLTFVGPYDEKQISAAIRRELLREGQVFFVHNRVESIDRVAKRIRELVPEARTATGHGQMGEAELEQVMVGFWEKDYDVLVCTTIVESGWTSPTPTPSSSTVRTPSACPSCTRSAVASGAAGSGPTRTSPTSLTSRSPSWPTTGWPPSRRTPRSARAWRSP
jgi:transcription-repair coupling factor (superfamily II helicase)